MDTYRPEYSNGTITQYDCQQFLDEVNACPGIQRAGCCGILCWLCLLVLATFATCMAIYGTSCAKYYKDNFALGTSGGNYYYADNVEQESMNLGIGLGLIGVLGIATLITVFCFKVQTDVKLFNTRSQIISLIIKKHLNSTFNGKNAFLMQAPLSGYLYIRFANPQMVQAGQIPMMNMQVF